MTDSDVTFGDWLRRQRRALDLTRAELAARVGCSVSALRKFEADELRPSRPLAESLAGALQIAPEGRAAFVRFARDTPGADTTCLPVATVSLQHPAPRSTVRSTMPAPATTLIGREQERAALGQLVCRSHTRLLTLTGPGGSGKTRLALQVATDVQAAFADGAVFVDLAPIRDPALVTATIARPFGLLDVGAQPLMQRLQTALRDTHLLLVLDNFEHVLVAAPVVAGLLAAAPRLMILLTSRVVVGVYGEHTFPVPPLRLPDLHALPPVDQLLQVETVRLFVVRAQATRLDFRLTHANARAVSEICHRLDGLPLSIELAAMRVRLLPPQALLDGLNSRLSMLTGGPRTLPARQQTLRDTLAWSYDLLDAHEQGLFRRLAVFVGGCTLAAVERVCDVDGDLGLDALKGLASLLDNSLLQQWEGSDGEPRFSMLETIREYALERLATSGMAETIQGAHADYYLALAEAAEIQVRDGAEKLWLHRLEVEYPNLRVALVRSQTEADGIAELRLVLALNWFWLRSGYLSEGHLWLADALTPRAGAASRPDTAASRALRAKALAQLGSVASWQNDQAAAQPALEESLALFRELGDTWSIADTLATLGMVVLLRGDYQRSGALLEESLTLFRDIEDSGGIGECFFFMGNLAYAQGNLRPASECWQKGLSLFRQLENTWMMANSLLHLGIAALDQGDDGRAGAYLAESLTRLREMGERWAAVHTLEVCAGLAAAQAHQRADAEGAGRRAARLFGAAEALREKLGAPLLPIYHDHYQRGVAATRAHLDEATFAAAWAEGRAMMLEQAIAEALDAINDRPIARTTEDVNAAVR